MALKDWKKNSEYSWSKKMDKVELIVDYTSSHNIIYTVEIFVWETQSKNAKTIIKDFPNRTKALQFALDYMRKH